ncbi:hypothetical protein [Bacillus sp. P14.5]|uniref:hypothetical protein n=1 Tax=Bacillus sp. P14.5 TaxID=1983400 RepID=UPI000DE85808|nr:hypothetical protein [Bacillus sp. P14.5]
MIKRENVTIQENYNVTCSDPFTRSTAPNINQPCDGISRIYYEDFSEPGFYSVLVTNGNIACPLIVTIETANGTTIERTVPFRWAFYIDDLEKISVRCAENPESTCTGILNINKTFRFCNGPILDKEQNYAKSRKD